MVDITPVLIFFSKLLGCVLHRCWPAALFAAVSVLLVESGGGGTLLAAAGDV